MLDTQYNEYAFTIKNYSFYITKKYIEILQIVVNKLIEIMNRISFDLLKKKKRIVIYSYVSYACK